MFYNFDLYNNVLQLNIDTLILLDYTILWFKNWQRLWWEE